MYSGVTEELLRQRVQGLQTTLATFQGAADEDAWSSSADEKDDPQGNADVPCDVRAARKPQQHAGASTGEATKKRAAAGDSRKNKNNQVR